MKRFNTLLAALIVFAIAGCSDDDNKETPLPADQINDAICKRYDDCGILALGLDITHEQCLVQVGNERTNDAKKYPLCSDALDDLNRCLISMPYKIGLPRPQRLQSRAYWHVLRSGAI